MSTRIVYQDIAPGASDTALTSYTNDDVYHSAPARLFSGSDYSPITLEPNRWVLDGTFSPVGPYAFWSSAQSDSDGEFTDTPTIDITFTDPITSQGATILFDVEYCTEVQITWDGSDVQTFYPDAQEYFCEHYVSEFTTLKIELLKTIPGRYARLQKIIIGAIRTFGMGELEKVTVVQEQDELTLPLSTLSFNLIPKTPTAYMFQERQPLSVETDHGLVSVFYVDKARREALRYVVDAVDAIGILDQTEYPGAYQLSAYSAQAWILDIVNGAFPVTFDVVDVNLPDHVGIVGGSARDAIQQILFACGWAMTTDGEEGLRVFSLPSSGAAIPDARTYFGGKINTELPVSKVTVTAHTLYEDLNGSVEINGTKYDDVTQSYSVTNPKATKANEISIPTCYLISPGTMAATAQRVYDYYANLSSVTVPIVWAGERLGERYNFVTGWDSLTGNIRKKTLRVSNTIKAEVNAR